MVLTVAQLLVKHVPLEFASAEQLPPVPVWQLGLIAMLRQMLVNVQQRQQHVLDQMLILVLLMGNAIVALLEVLVQEPLQFVRWAHVVR